MLSNHACGKLIMRKLLASHRVIGIMMISLYGTMIIKGLTMSVQDIVWRWGLRSEEGSSGGWPKVSWWRKLWSLRITSKVKIHIWRAFHGILLVFVNLRNRGVNYFGRCHRCGELEYVARALFYCEWSSEVWCHSSIW